MHCEHLEEKEVEVRKEYEGVDSAVSEWMLRHCTTLSKVAYESDPDVLLATPEVREQHDFTSLSRCSLIGNKECDGLCLHMLPWNSI